MHNHSKHHFVKIGLESRLARMQTMETQGFQLLLLLLCVVPTCWGQQVYLTLGSGPSITTDNTEILITAIGEDGVLPSLTCHTDLTACCRSSDNNGNGALGQWTYPDGSVILQNGASATAGQQFYIVRGEPQVIRLARRETTNPVTPTGSYCCTVPTTGGDMTLCANLVVSPVCLSLPTLTNGVISYSDESRSDDTVATHTCNTGYTLSGGTTRTCGSGVWSGSPPTCQSNCPDLPSLTNGMIMYNAGSTNSRPFSSCAVHSCNPGYTRIGGITTRVCTSGGRWDGSAPTCQATCSDLTVPANGMISYNMGTASLRPVDTVATYTCTTGYTLNGGTTTRTCGSDGVWSGSAPTCQTNCPDLPSLTNGMIMYSAGSTNNRPLGSSAVHSCNPGYTLIGGDTTRICVSGGWDGSAPTCQSTCSDLTVPANGMIGYNMGTGSPRPVDTVATYTCNTGYTLSGDTTRTCESDRLWSGLAPTCLISCGPPPSIDNGSPEQPTSTMIGGEATFTCDTGYLLIGSETITCLSAGNWSSSPSCQIPPPVYLSLSSTNYLSGLSEIPLSSVGEGSGLVCHTDLAGCCGNTGDWYYPNGSVVIEDGALYVSRGQMSVSLIMSGTATAPGGVYCCVVPTSGGRSTACIVLASTDESSPCPQSDNTVAVVGGAVALVAVVTIVTGVVMVTYLVLRYKRGGKMTVTQDISLTDQGQSAAATYETVPAVYDEIPASKNVKGDYVFSQNNAYSTVSGRL